MLTEAWKDPDWGMLLSLKMTTGARRGEICGLHWPQLDLDTGVAVFQSSIGQIAGDVWEKDIKTHQHRRVTLDPEIVEALRAHRARCEERAASVDTRARGDGFVFSPTPGCSVRTSPNTLTQRYGRLADRVGIATHLHSLRHYSATELIAAGVDIRTVAGRLGHSGGGSTTLRTWAQTTARIRGGRSTANILGSRAHAALSAATAR